MNAVRKISTVVVCSPIAAIGVGMMFAELIGVGIFVVLFAALLANIMWPGVIARRDAACAVRNAAALSKEARGVHAFWWIFWAIVFFPMLIVVAIVHVGRKNRAAIRQIRAA
jgi:hypothetical protein